MNTLNIAEIFTSIDGEVNGAGGQGRQTAFIRLAGCNLKCEYCDTKKYQSPISGKEMKFNEIKNFIKSKNIKDITITGGEPLLQKEQLENFFLDLSGDECYYINIETNGSIEIPNYWKAEFCTKFFSFVVDYKISTPEIYSMLISNWQLLDSDDYIKIVIEDDQVGIIRGLYYAIRNKNKYVNVAFSPIWDDNLKTYQFRCKKIIDKLESNNIFDAALNIQLHKILNFK